LVRSLTYSSSHSSWLAHCQWAIQSTHNNDTDTTDDTGDTTDDFNVIHVRLLAELNTFADHFDGSDKASIRAMITKMLQKLGNMRATDCSQEWKKLKAFAWKTRFPGRVPISVVKLRRTPKVLEWRSQNVRLERDLQKIRHLLQDRDTAGSHISTLIRGWNAVTLNEVALVDDTFNGIAAVAGDAPIEIAAVADDTLNVVEDGTDDTLNEVPSEHTHPLHVPADDQDDASEMSSH
jgi:hypothetical protein